MIQLHMNRDDYAYSREQSFRPFMQVSDSPEIALSKLPWNWYARRQSVFNRDAWLFIEAESLFVVCFFDLRPRDVRQLDLTLWLRLVSEYTYMSQQQIQGKPLPLCHEFLAVTRSWMAPMQLTESFAPHIDEFAEYIFSTLKQFLKRPLPMPTPLKFEMEFCWDINNSNAHLQFNKNTITQTITLEEKIRSRHSLFSGTSLDPMNLSLDKLDIDALNLDDLEVMDLIHHQVRSNLQNALTPVCLFTGRMALMVDKEKNLSGNVVQFEPRA